MLGRRRSLVALMAAAALGGILTAEPAGAVENGLIGVRIGASYREILNDKRLGPSTGILFSAGGSMMYQTTQPTGRALAGLPGFPTAAASGEAPVWVFPLRPAALAEDQSEWVYDWRKTKGVAVGIILSGQGADAVVTDVIVAGFSENLRGKAVSCRTEKGIVLQSTFSEVLKKYGFPPMIEIYAWSSGAGSVQRAAGVGGAAAGARGGRAMRVAGAGAGAGAGGASARRTMRAGGAGTGRGGTAGRSGGGRGMGTGGRRGAGGRGGMMRGAADATTTAVAQAAGYQVQLTGGMMGGGGGMRGGGGRGRRAGGGGMARRAGAGGAGQRPGAGGTGQRAAGGGTRRGVGAGALPPLGQQPAASAPVDLLTATAVVDNQAIGFSRDCILTYESISFTLHDMRVVRIHVSE